MTHLLRAFTFLIEQPANFFKRFYSLGDFKLIWNLQIIEKTLWTVLVLKNAIAKIPCKRCLNTVLKSCYIWKQGKYESYQSRK